MSPVELLAASVRRLREQHGWSQEELAERSGLHRTYISGLERAARNPTVAVLVKIADAFEVKLGELFS